MVPPDTPNTIPLVVPTDATAVLALLHMPPPVALRKVDIEPAQMPVMPVILAGRLLTVIGFTT